MHSGPPLDILGGLSGALVDCQPLSESCSLCMPTGGQWPGTKVMSEPDIPTNGLMDLAHRSGSSPGVLGGPAPQSVVTVHLFTISVGGTESGVFKGRAALPPEIQLCARELLRAISVRRRTLLG